jgi:hypothetical protein
MLELPVRLTPSADVSSLAHLPSSEEIRTELLRLGSACGSITSVLRLPERDANANHEYLVTFERTQDALTASRLWQCYLFGFTSVLVSIRCAESASAAR